MALLLVNSTLGLFWCTDCGEEVDDLSHFCLLESKEDNND
jgi:hypothetical protein